MATGPAAHTWVTEGISNGTCSLKTDERGFFSIKDTLQTVSSPRVFACGDCCSFERFKGAFPPKAGVYAVRMGPILINNLKILLALKSTAAAAADSDKNEGNLHHHHHHQQQQQQFDQTVQAAESQLKQYEPQREFLSLMVLGKERAMGAKWSLSFAGHWVWLLKDHIDRKWMRLFDLPEGEREGKGEGEGGQAQAAAGCVCGGGEEGKAGGAAATSVVVPEQQQQQQQQPEYSQYAGLLHGTDDKSDEYHERLKILEKMHTDADFRDAVLAHVQAEQL